MRREILTCLEDIDRKIVDTRNRIIHGYDSVTADILWLIISKPLPMLHDEVKKLLA